MLTYIYAGEVLCEKCGRAIREKLKAESKAPIFPDNPWSYNSKDYPKGPYYSEEHTRGPLFNCAKCSCPLGRHHRPEGRITDPWTDSLPKSPEHNRGKYGNYIPRIVQMNVISQSDRRRRGGLPKERGGM